MAEIVLDRVSKVYSGGVKGVNDLSLEISDGEFMVLVGPSGCGKSTALLSIAGLEEITSGTITIGGRVVNNLPPNDRDIAMVFENYALYPHMTVEQNLAFGLQQRKTPKAEITRRVNEVARMLGIGEYLKRKPAALSGGQRQRVAMGRAIVREPRLPHGRAVVQSGREAARLDARVAEPVARPAGRHHRLRHARPGGSDDPRAPGLRPARRPAAAGGHPQALYDHPVNLFVAGFMGSPAMNFVTAELVRDDGPAVTFAGHRLPLPPELVEAKPGLDQYFGRELILGIRPAEFEDAALADPDWARMQVTANVTEELGSEIHVIFALDATPVSHPSISDAVAADGDADEAAVVLAGGKSMWTARVASRSRVRSGQPIELAVHTSNLQFFDPDSGLAIGHPETSGS